MRARGARRHPGPQLPLRRAAAGGGRRGAHRAAADPGGPGRRARARRATPATPPRPAGSATPTRSCAGSARRPSTRATATSSSRSGPTWTTTCAAARIAREVHRPGPAPDGRRQPGLGRRHGDRLDARAQPLRPAVDRGADQPRRRARPRDHPAGRGAGRRGHRRARDEPGAVQAAVPGRGDRLLPARLLPPRQPQRDPAGDADGGEVRHPGLPARRRRRALRAGPAPVDHRLPARLRAAPRAGSPSTSTTCTSTSSTRASSRARPTCCPPRPGYSAQMHEASLAAYAYPGGTYWAGRPSVA